MSDPLTPDQIKAAAKEFAKSMDIAAAGLTKLSIEITKSGISISTSGEKPPKPTPEPT